MSSPQTIRLSLAAAMTLGFKDGRFYRDAKLGCINLLMEYEKGCTANCQYCGQAREIADTPTCKNLIRVGWPSYDLEDVIRATREVSEKDSYVRRVCVSALTRRQAPRDLIEIVRRVREGTDLKISTLITPTVFSKEHMEEIRDSGAENITIAVDCASPGLFERLRGQGARGPHVWDRYLGGIADAVDVMDDGPNAVGVHLIIGLGETEEEAVDFMQKCYDMGARVHLFSFYPERGSALQDGEQPPMDVYRRMQMARHLMDRGLSSRDAMTFRNGTLEDFGVPSDVLEKEIESGVPFMTSGCPGCNRPYANETPTQAMDGLLRNFPFRPTEGDISRIRQQF